MIRLYKYDMAYTFRKVSTWIILGVLFLLSFLTILGSGVDENNSAKILGGVRRNVLENMASTMTFILVLLIIISISYTSLKAANIFKDGEKDGTTLLIISKPFTRKEVIFSKLLSAITHMFLPAFVFFMAFLIGDLIFDLSFMKENILYILAYTLGIFVIDIIFMSISLLLASVLGKTGTSILTMVLFLFIWIAGLILPVAGRASGASTEVGHIYNLKDNKFKSAVNEDEYLKNKLDRYPTLAYFDIWYQISGPFELAWKNPTKEYLVDVKQRKKAEQEKLLEDSKITLEELEEGKKSKSSDYYFYVDNRDDNDINRKSIQNGWTSKKIIESINNDKQIDANIEKTTKALRKYFDKHSLPKPTPDSDDTSLSFYDSKATITSYSALYVWFKKHAGDVDKIHLSAVKNEYNYTNLYGWIGDSEKEGELILNSMVIENYGANLLESFKSLEEVKNIPNLYHFSSFKDYNDNRGIVRRDIDQNIKDQVEYKGKSIPYIAPWIRTAIWVFISLLMITGVTIVYMRRDFK